MVKAIRTFADRLVESLSGFSTIEEYTEWFLAKNGELLEQSFHEVPLDTLKNQAVDIIAVVDSHIDDFGWWESFDTDQLLVSGQEVDNGYDIVIYKQGYVRAN